jgi:fucose permease
MKNIILQFGNRRLLNISFFYAMFLFGINLVMISPVLIELSKVINTDIKKMGNYFALLAAGLIFGALINIILNRFKIRRIVFISIYLMQSFGILALAFVTSYFFLLFCGFLIGLSNGLLESNITIVIAEINKEQESRYINLSQGFISLGAFAGPMISTLMVNYGVSLKKIFIFVSMLCFLNFIFILFLKLPAKKVSEIKDIKSIRLKKYPVFGLLTIIILFTAAFFNVCAESGIEAWIPTFLRLEKNFSSIFAGNIISFFGLATAIGRFIISWISNKIRFSYTLIAIAILSLITYKIGIDSNQKWVISLFILLTGFFVSGIWPLLVALGIKIFPKHNNMFIIFAVMIGGGGGIFSPWFIGVIYRLYDLTRGFNLIFIFFILAVLFITAALFCENKILIKNKNLNNIDN